MSTMGIYSVCPGKNYFDIGILSFSKIKLNLEEGRTSILSNQDELFRKTSISYYALTKIPEKEFHTAPVSETIIPSPIISGSQQVFSDSILVEIKPLYPNSKIEFSCHNMGESKVKMSEYSKPFYIKDSKEVSAISKSATGSSNTVSAKFYKRPNKWKINILSKYNSQYNAGGDEGIIDGLHGDENWRKGRWQGYQGQDFECIINLEKETQVSKLSIGFLQDTRSWILMPTKMEVSFSDDNTKFSVPLTVTNTIKDNDLFTQVKNLELEFKQQPAHYVKIKAYNYGKLPSWHQGAGGDAFIFIDEISIE